MVIWDVVREAHRIGGSAGQMARATAAKTRQMEARIGSLDPSAETRDHVDAQPIG
jgi:hypothetical protein